MVKFYIKTPAHSTYQLLNSYSGVDSRYTYSHYFDASSYMIGGADTTAQLYVEVIMDDSSQYTQTSVTSLAPVQINLCWDLNNDGTADDIAADHIMEIDQGSGTSFSLVLCGGETSLLSDVNYISYFLKVSGTSAGEESIGVASQMPFRANINGGSSLFTPSPGGEIGRGAKQQASSAISSNENYTHSYFCTILPPSVNNSISLTHHPNLFAIRFAHRRLS